MRIPGTALELRAPVTDTRPRERHLAAVPATTAAGTTIPRGASGIDGDSPFLDLMHGGIDMNPELSGYRKFYVYEEMRKADAAVKSALWMYKLPIRQADWALDPFSDDGDDQLIADACAWQFGLEEQDGQLDLTWDEWLQQSMLMFDFGSMGEEVVWGDPVIWWPTGDDGGNSRIIRPIARFAPRFPSTVGYIDTDPATGAITRIRQNLANADWIRGEFLCWYALEREGTNWYGTSLLRAMYGPWKLKKQLMIAAGIGWDRFSSGVPVVRYPKGGGAREKQEAIDIARNYRTHERAWVTFEGAKGEGWDLEVINGTVSMADPAPLIRLYDEQIAMAALQQFSKLGVTATGARAVGEILIDPFYQAVAAHANYLAQKRQRGAIRRFVDANWGPEYDTPRLRVGKIQSKNVMVFAQAIELLSAAGMSFTDRATQNDIRDVLDLQHLPETLAQAIDALPDDAGIAATVPPSEGDGLPVKT